MNPLEMSGRSNRRFELQNKLAGGVFQQSGAEEDNGVDASDWDPNDPAKRTVKKKQRRYSFEHPSSSKRQKSASKIRPTFYK